MQATVSRPIMWFVTLPKHDNKLHSKVNRVYPVSIWQTIDGLSLPSWGIIGLELWVGDFPLQQLNKVIHTIECYTKFTKLHTKLQEKTILRNRRFKTVDSDYFE